MEQKIENIKAYPAYHFELNLTGTEQLWNWLICKWYYLCFQESW